MNKKCLMYLFFLPLFLLAYSRKDILRRVREKFELYPNIYEDQFNYQKFQPIKEVIRAINTTWGVEIGITDINIDPKKISYEKIRGAIYEILSESDDSVFKTLRKKWGQYKGNAKKLALNFINEYQNLRDDQLYQLLIVSDYLNISNKNDIKNKIENAIKHSFKLDNLFMQDLDKFKEKIENLKQGSTIIIMPDTVHGMIFDMFVLANLLKDKNVNVKFLLKEYKGGRIETSPTIKDFKEIKEELNSLDLNNFEAIKFESPNPGFHLDEFNQELINEIKNAEFLIIKGGINAVTTQYINKEHFLIGLAQDIQTQHFTGLYWKNKDELPPAYIAYVPPLLAVSIFYDSDRPTIQNLVQFVQINIDDRISLSEKEIEKINTSGVGIVYFKKPDILSKNYIAKNYYKSLQKELENGKSLEEAIKNVLLKMAYILHPMEIEKVANGELLTKNQNVIYKRIFYIIDNNIREAKSNDFINMQERDAQNKAKRISGNLILISLDSQILNFHTADELGTDLLVSPQKVISEKYSNKKGIIINGGYFITRKLIDNFNSINNSYKISYQVEGMYLGFFKKDNKFYPPLYNKGAIIITKDNRIIFTRARLRGGRFNGENVKINLENPGRQDIVVYTPEFEKNMVNEFKKLLLEKIKQNATLNALEDEINNVDNYDQIYNLIDPYQDNRSNNEKEALKKLITELVKAKFLIKIPKRNKVIKNFVIIGNKIVAIKNGDEETIIPPYGWVLSIPQNFIDKKYKVGDEIEGFTPEIEFKNGNENINLSIDNIKIAIGGLTLLPNKVNEINDAMKEEGTHLISSRRTQETDFAMIDVRNPRQVIGIVEKDSEKYLLIFTISGRTEYSGGANFYQLLEMINEQLKNYNIIALINLDDGSSVSTSYFTNANLFNLNIPAPGPNSKANQIREVNSVFVIEL